MTRPAKKQVKSLSSRLKGGWPPAKPPKKVRPPSGVSVEPDPKIHMDRLGKSFNVGDHVLAVQNNRLVVAKVVRLTQRRVTIKPVLHERSFASPKEEELSRECFNVALIEETDIPWAYLRSAI